MDAGRADGRADFEGLSEAGPGIVAGKPTQSFINIGIGHNLNANTSVKLLYQIGQYRDKSTGFGFGSSVVVSGLYLLPSTIGITVFGLYAGGSRAASALAQHC